MAAELKEGRELYKSGKFGDAAAKFGSALEDDSTEVDQLHMIHSNRCACYMQLKAFDKAYDDAEACTSLKPTWAKGWARLAAACDALGKLPQAAAAYEKAAELDPANGAQHLNDAAKVKAKADAANGAGNYRRVPFPEQRSVQPVGFLCLSLVMHWGRAHGRPKMDRAYAQKCMTDPGCQRLFGAFILLLGQGSFIALLPLLYFEAAASAHAVVAKLKSVGLKSQALQATAALEGTLLDGDGQLDAKVVVNCAYAEAGAGLLMVLELLTPRRNFILLVLYWQYMQMRIMLEGAATGGAGGPLHAAFGAVDAKVVAVVGNPACPALLRGAYGKIKQLAKNQVALPEPGKKPGLKCTIM
ncbi:hypothetical protein JL720_3638 [Aureococcus anophagefferens]|nr:hypothetical protein JL720_3638 [Aureococcus anophagefferens]